MQKKLLQYALGFTLTLLIFCYATKGDFSWVTLTGPLLLEPNLTNLEGPSYIASPALQAVITRFLFLVICGFFCMIPNLANGLRTHAFSLLALLAAVYLFFSYILGTLTFFMANTPGTTALRIASIICIGLLLIICNDPVQKKFKIPVILTKTSFILPLFCTVITLCLVNGIVLQGFSWLFNEHLHFALLRMGVLLTALAGALTLHAWKHGS